MSEKKHISIVICGHVDSGKSTTTGRLLFELGGIDKREMEKYKAEAAAIGKSSFAFAFILDRQSDERARGVTISCTTKEFFTDRYHYTIIDAPGHRDFIKNMITGSSQADLGVVMIPADGNFTTAIQRGNHKLGEVPGQTRQHARLLLLLGVKQLLVCVNKMDGDLAHYKQARYEEVKNVMVDMLAKTGWKKEQVASGIPVLPISGWHGDNLIVPSTNMPWWTGGEYNNLEKEKIKVVTLLDALDKFAVLPDRNITAKPRMPVSGVFKIKGSGDVITGRIEQGIIEPNREVTFLPTGCSGKIFSVEMHHKKMEKCQAGDNVGINVKGLSRDNMPRVGDVMIYKDDPTLKPCKSFTAQVTSLDIPNEIKVGYSPIAFIRTAHSACKITKIHWKHTKQGKVLTKVENPHSIKANEYAEVTFEPAHPICCEDFKKSESLGRTALLDGNTCVLLGKIVSVEFK